MIKNLTSNQLLLLALAGVVLLIAAFSFYLLQDPSAPLPFVPPPPTSTQKPPPPSETPLATFTVTPVPTRQTSYTPFASTYTPSSGTPSSVIPTTITPPGATASQRNTTSTPNPSKTAVPGATTPAQSPARSATLTVISTSSAATPTPTQTTTLSPGEIGVTGRVLQNGTPVAYVIVSFEDDVAPRQSTTTQGGHYSFTTLAPGTTFLLTFNQKDNPQLTPVNEITSQAWIKGTLPMNVNPIDLPDFEISLNQNDMLFELQSPMDGAAYSASVISQAIQLQFIWSFYGLGGSYHLELGPNGSDQPILTSGQLTSSYLMWDGTLDDGTHISEGAYWWRVAVTKSLGNYVEVIFTQRWDLLFNP
ncbi:MAG TPA: hypothetical protein VLD65_10900 [Anaerolineales bacterium]|nr:hypothetical protein [Anaerolineales bacterium]